MGRGHTPLSVGLAVAETLSHRLPVFWDCLLSPTPRGNATLAEMVTEKQIAFAEGLMGMQAELMRQALRPWWTWTPQQGQNAARKLVDAAVAPASRKVKANARRLRKKKS